MEPIRANCCRYSGLQSVLAPMSMTIQAPSLVGRRPPRAGRSTPWMRLRAKSEAAIIAPLLPAETAPTADPSFTNSTVRTIEVFLFRTAFAGLCSSMGITSPVCTTGKSSPCVSCLASSAAIVSSRPTRYTPNPYSRAACTAPNTVSPGALSPPMASRATRIVVLISDISPRLTNRGSLQFYELVQVKRLIDNMHYARLTKFRFLAPSRQKSCDNNYRYLVIDTHRHKFQFVAPIQVRHHQIKQNQIWLVFAYSIVETQALRCHIRFIALFCQGLCQ